MEFDRFAKIEELKQSGWFIDEECERLIASDDRCGGPTYIKNARGEIHAVCCGEVEKYLAHDERKGQKL